MIMLILSGYTYIIVNLNSNKQFSWKNGNDFSLKKSKKFISIFLGFKKFFFASSCYLIILHVLFQFDPILMQSNPEIYPPPWYVTLKAPHDRIKSAKCM